MATVIKTTFKLRRGSLEEWMQANPVLAAGEPGFAIDANILKIGNGANTWKELPAIQGGASISPDQSSLTYNANGDLVVMGFETAEPNQVPIKNEQGDLIWISLSKVATSGLIDDLSQKNTILLSCGSAPVPSEDEI